MALQSRPAQTKRLADLVNGENRPKPVPIGKPPTGTAGQNFVGKNSQFHCPVCEFITSLQILREIFSADDSQCCPLHLLEVRGYVTRSGYGKKAISREAVLPLSIHNIDRDPKTGQAAFPEQQVLSRIRAILAARSGKPLAALLSEQETRRQQALLEPQTNKALPAPESDSEHKDPPIQRRERAS